MTARHTPCESLKSSHPGQQPSLIKLQPCVWRRSLCAFMASSVPSRLILFPVAPSQGGVYDRDDPRARNSGTNGCQDPWTVSQAWNNHISCGPQGPKIPPLCLCILGGCDFLLIPSELWTLSRLSPRSTYSCRVKLHVFLLSSKKGLRPPYQKPSALPSIVLRAFSQNPVPSPHKQWTWFSRRADNIVLHL